MCQKEFHQRKSTSTIFYGLMLYCHLDLFCYATDTFIGCQKECLRFDEEAHTTVRESMTATVVTTENASASCVAVVPAPREPRAR